MNPNGRKMNPNERKMNPNAMLKHVYTIVCSQQIGLFKYEVQ